MFDTATYLDAIQPPRFRHRTRRGRVVEHVGRFLSVDEWLAFQPRVMALLRGDTSAAEQRALMLDIATAIFPPRPVDALLGRTVGQILLTLPVAAQGEAFLDFCDSQLRALGMPTFRPATSPQAGAPTTTPPTTSFSPTTTGSAATPAAPAG